MPVSPDHRTRILVVTPPGGVRRTGNRCTASQYAAMLEDCGHVATVTDHDTGERPDLLFALHAERSAPAVEAYRRNVPDGRVVVVATGTDIYPEVSEIGAATFRLADRIVVLQEDALTRLGAAERAKARVIVQSAERRAERPCLMRGDRLQVCVVGHFREVKDPLLAAAAVRRLPGTSRIAVRHAGGILEEAFRQRALAENRDNPRWEWLGELDELATARLLASSELMVLTSRQEGGARVVGEAFVHGTPVLSTRTDGVVGLLGADYPGFFPVGDSESLAEMLSRFEEDDSFRSELEEARAAAAPRFHPDREREALRQLVEDLNLSETPAE